MKKTIIILIILSLALVCSMGCGTKSEGLPVSDEPTTETAEDDEAQTGRVHFSDIKYDPESGSLMYTIVNDTGEAVTLGGDILLRKRTIDGLWVDMQPLQRNGDGIRFLVTELVEIGAGESHEGSLDLKNIYGTLLEGEYGISVQVGTSHGSETILGGFRVAPVM